MKYFRKFLLWVVDCWRLVMDNHIKIFAYIIVMKSTNIFHISLICHVVCLLWVRCKFLYGVVRIFSCPLYRCSHRSDSSVAFPMQSLSMQREMAVSG